MAHVFLYPRSDGSLQAPACRRVVLGKHIGLAAPPLRRRRRQIRACRRQGKRRISGGTTHKECTRELFLIITITVTCPRLIERSGPGKEPLAAPRVRRAPVHSSRPPLPLSQPPRADCRHHLGRVPSDDDRVRPGPQTFSLVLDRVRRRPLALHPCVLGRSRRGCMGHLSTPLPPSR